MITEEVFAKVQECFKPDGSPQDQVTAGIAVILNAVDDDPEAISGTPDRLTAHEARLLAELLQSQWMLKDTVKSLSERLEQGVQLNVNMMTDLQHRLDEGDMDEVDMYNWFADEAGITTSAACAIFDHLRWLEDHVSKRERETNESMLATVKAESERREANAWNAGEIERQRANAWEARAKKLRLALIQLAEAPNVCEQCKSSLLAPAPHPDDVLKGLGQKKPE